MRLFFLVHFHNVHLTKVLRKPLNATYRLRDNQPLYDILRQFQKGNSHIGIVVKSKQNIKSATEITSDTARYEVKVSINGSQEQPLRKGKKDHFLLELEALTDF